MSAAPYSYSYSRGTPPRNKLRSQARINSRQHPWNRRRERIYIASSTRASWDDRSSNSGSAQSATDSSIFKGAEILRAEIRQQQSDAADENVLRGAASVKAQLMASESQRQYSSPAASDEWSDPWEKKSDTTHPKSCDETCSSSADVTDSPRLSTPHSDFSSPTFDAAPVSEESAPTFPDDDAYEGFDDIKKKLDMKRSPNAPNGRKTPPPTFPNDNAFVMSDDENSNDDEEIDTSDLDAHYTEAMKHSREEFDEMGFPLAEWATDSSTASTEPPPPPPKTERPPTPPPPPPTDEGALTPVTLMGRGKSLKLKIHTYNVQRTDDLTDNDTHSSETISTIDTPSTGTKSTGSYCDSLAYSNSLEEATSGRDSLAYSNSLEETPTGRDSLRSGSGSLSSFGDFELSASSSSYLPGKYSGQGSKLTDSDDEGPKSSYIPRQFQPERVSPAISPRILSPMTATYKKLARDPAYRHAQRAGLLWQTLASQHVRFPGHWWDGARSPQMGMMEDFLGNGKAHCNWQYIASHRVYSNPELKKLVRNRASAGRLLLHIVVRDLITHLPVQDIAIGCFHPNARGVRLTESPDPNQETCREVWMAVRKRCEDGAVSAVDRYLTRGRSIEDVAQKSPLRGRPRISNQNMRAVFGERPPVQTLIMLESDLYERMTIAEEERPESAKEPALLLLWEFFYGP